MDVIIKGAGLVDSTMDSRTSVGDIVIENGCISDVVIGDCGIASSDKFQMIDAHGLTAMPAFVDLHAHFRDPGLTYKEDIESGSKAAVRGGYTTVNLMANTKPVCSSMDTVNYVKRRAEEVGLVDVHQTVSITKDFDWRTLSHLDELDDSVMFISDDGKGSPIPNDVMLKAMNKAEALNLTILSHAEDFSVSNSGDRIAEDLMTTRDLTLAAYTGCKLHMCHVSTKDAIESIICAKKRSVPVTCEVTPHHLALTSDMEVYKVAPPLRRETDRFALIKALTEGWIDAIATDHAPHTPEDKLAGSPGISGIETSFAVCNTYLVRRGHISLSCLSEHMSDKPARLMNLCKGKLLRGYDADIVLVDPDRKFVLSAEDMVSRGKNTPFIGKELFGDVVMTLKKGEKVYSSI